MSAGLVNALISDQTVSPSQFQTQLPYQTTLVNLLDLSHHLSGKDRALDTGCGQQLLRFLSESPDALLNDRLYPGWQRIPVESGSLDPGPRLPPDQVSPFLHGPQQLDGKQGMPTGVCKEGLAKILAQFVGLGIEEFVDEHSALCAVITAEIHHHFAVQAPELGLHLLQRVPHSLPPQGDFLWAVCTDHQDAAAPQSPPKVEEQSRRACVHPLQVIEDEQ